MSLQHNIVFLTQGVVAELNNPRQNPDIGFTTFSLPFVAKRAYDPAAQLETLSGLTVIVQSGKKTSEAADRADLQGSYDVVMSFQQLTTPGNLLLADGVIGLMEEIDQYLFHMPSRRLAAFPGGIWESSELTPVIARHVHEDLLYEGYLIVTFRIFDDDED
jgi:hypothetical protein